MEYMQAIKRIDYYIQCGVCSKRDAVIRAISIYNLTDKQEQHIFNRYHINH